MITDQILQAFIIKTVAVVTEALPFILIGSMVSAALHVYVPEDRLHEKIPKGTFRQILAGISLSLFLPTCECGIVPVVRGLAEKKVPAPMTAAYLIAAPVVNPLTVLSTYIGFRNSVPMTVSRVFISLAAAFAVGYLFSFIKEPFKHSSQQSCSCGCGHDHTHEHDRHHKGNIKDFLAHGRDDFFSTLSYLIAGAVFASAFQTFMPSSFLERLSGSGVVSILAMMAFAVILSVCAEADSFVAASFVHFSSASQLAFVGIGSMFDLKLLLMYQKLFNKKVMTAMIILAVFVVIVMCLLLSLAGLVTL